MKTIIPLIALLVFSGPGRAEIPDWYKRDIGAHLASAAAVILYRIESVSLHSNDHHQFLYRLDTTTIEALKGVAPRGSCYLIQAESEMNMSRLIGETELVILNRKFDSECGQIEPGYGAPGTEEYVVFFREALKET